MSISPDKVERIAIEVIKVLFTRFDTFPEDATNNRNAPFHEAFLEAFKDRFAGKVSDIPIFISLSSWCHGLNTTVGQTFFEKVAHVLCDGIKREFKGLKISHAQQTTITDIITDLKNGIHTPSLTREDGLIFQNNVPRDKDVSNFTADCYFEDSEKIVAIELKTVKPNSGVFRNEKDKILSAKAGLKNVYPDKKVFFYLGFPFDPLSEEPTGSDKNGFMNYSIGFTKFFEQNEVLLADELWNFLSGDDNTMQQLLNIINAIATPQFMEKYEFLNDPANKATAPSQYIRYLSEWYLTSEITLLNNEEAIIQKITNNNRLTKIFNQPIFKIYKENEHNKIKYNIERFNALKVLLN